MVLDRAAAKTELDGSTVCETAEWSVVLIPFIRRRTRWQSAVSEGSLHTTIHSITRARAHTSMHSEDNVPRQ